MRAVRKKGSAISILLIDDDAEDCEIFQEIIEEIDSRIECIIKQGCEECLGYLKKSNATRPDYIFIDLNMPRLDGHACLSSIKKLKDLNRIPVIIYSSSNNPEDVQQAKDLGAFYYLNKRGSLLSLKTELRSVLGYKRIGRG